MKAVLSKQAGGPESLVVEDVADPVPAVGEVVVDVRACAVNYPDLLIIEDRYQFKPARPFSPGGEVAGIVSAIGDEVLGFEVGSRVIAPIGWGGMAERVSCAANKCIKFPASMPFDEAAAFIGTYGTAYFALKQRGRIARGQSVLVLGAAGGVGLAAVELSRALGARVTAGVSSEAKLARAVASGAEQGVLYPATLADSSDARALADRFKEAAGPAGFDIVVDIVGGAYTEPALRAIAWGGRFLVVGFPAGIANLPMNLPLLKGCEVSGVFYGAFTEREPEEHERNTQELFALYEAGHIRPQITGRFPLEESGEAIKVLARREAQGKIVIMISQT